MCFYFSYLTLSSSPVSSCFENFLSWLFCKLLFYCYYWQKENSFVCSMNLSKINGFIAGISASLEVSGQQLLWKCGSTVVFLSQKPQTTIKGLGFCKLRVNQNNFLPCWNLLKLLLGSSPIFIITFHKFRKVPLRILEWFLKTSYFSKYWPEKCDLCFICKLE